MSKTETQSDALRLAEKLDAGCWLVGDHGNPIKEAVATLRRLDAENKALRLMLCTAYSGALAYMDDGEMQDSRYHPSIDFKRDAPDEIASKFARRAAAQAAAKTGDAA